MQILALIFSTVIPMLNPDGVPMGNDVIDPAGILARRAFNTIFDTNVSFTAIATISIQAPRGNGGLPQRQELSYTLHNDWERYEFDAANITNHADPEELAVIKQLGMDRAVWVMCAPKNIWYVIYPKQKLYVIVDQIPGLETSQEKPPKIDRTMVGEETLDGHKCAKYKTKVSCFMGDLQGMRWEASDLKGFPIKSLVEIDGATITTAFKDVKLQAPATDTFELPKDYKRYTGKEFFKYLEQIITKQPERQKE